MVDVAAGWTESFPLIVREAAVIVEALEREQNLFPWLVRGLDFKPDPERNHDPLR
ncbi:hypothetical protein [Bradyrhizobium valentinum]|uniref:hypothetical protein n=2 Tax=Bradyrhizobium TaxID=374 RepID=UPI000AFFB4E1|nr:hypothetical protein [Bradyrhizobium valentinum]